MILGWIIIIIQFFIILGLCDKINKLEKQIEYITNNQKGLVKVIDTIINILTGGKK